MLRDLLKTVALFCLSMILCPGCIFKTKTIKPVRSPLNREVSQHADQQASQNADQKALQSAEREVLQNKMEPLLEQFIPSKAPVLERSNCKEFGQANQEVFQHTDQAALQPVGQEPLQNGNRGPLQKDMASMWGRSEERNMTQVEGILGQSGLSSDQIAKLKKLYQETSCKLKEKFFKLPFFNVRLKSSNPTSFIWNIC